VGSDVQWTAHVTLSNGAAGSVGPHTNTAGNYSGSATATIGGVSVSVTVYAYVPSSIYCSITDAHVV
jgi:hypothetical protein